MYAIRSYYVSIGRVLLAMGTGLALIYFTSAIPPLGLPIQLAVVWLGMGSLLLALLVITSYSIHYTKLYEISILENENQEYLPEVKIRPGAIVPLSKVIQNTTEYSLETLDLYVCLDANGKAEGQLYHDAGDGYGYKNGAYALLTIKAEKKEDEVIITVSDKLGNFKINNKSTTVHLYANKKVIKCTGVLDGTIKLKTN